MGRDWNDVAFCSAPLAESILTTYVFLAGQPLASGQDSGADLDRARARLTK